MKNDARLKSFAESLGDHSVEGISILVAEPARLTQALIYTMVALVVSALVWSFVGRADVIVTAQGTLAPESEVRRFYAPIDGELADVYIAEGQPVSKDDVVARLNARGAIQAATNALEALIEPGPYTCGKQVTLADLCLVPQVNNARRLKVPLEKFPKIVAVDAACLALPAFDRARPENQPDAE